MGTIRNNTRLDRKYLNSEIIVNLHRLPEHGNILHQIGKLPAIP